ncbi:hypothetical protein [Paenibacillus sp. L3-i20]|uniref:hypothetical protein n=1 Tax=Paenibacillus sp. L3-i20 TaxID=2905833 RepID=UPI001EDDF8C8|nr:hypothetical protein [Paenibacillus sp. L3-i20]GKU77336.1 hypothetical protein L3i20_v217330 [Paenibacillus sp. L3-i20]
MRFGHGTNNQPTGLVAMPGDMINVYVDAETQVPSLIFSQQEGSWSSWGESVQLRPGKNTIVVPEEQGKAPRIRFEGLTQIPMMTKDTDVAEFKAFLTTYKEQLDADKAAYPNVTDRKMIDVVEMEMDLTMQHGEMLSCILPVKKSSYVAN